MLVIVLYLIIIKTVFSVIKVMIATCTIAIIVVLLLIIIVSCVRIVVQMFQQHVLSVKWDTTCPQQTLVPYAAKLLIIVIVVQ